MRCGPTSSFSPWYNSGAFVPALKPGGGACNCCESWMFCNCCTGAGCACEMQTEIEMKKAATKARLNFMGMNSQNRQHYSLRTGGKNINAGCAAWPGRLMDLADRGDKRVVQSVVDKISLARFDAIVEIRQTGQHSNIIYFFGVKKAVHDGDGACLYVPDGHIA